MFLRQIHVPEAGPGSLHCSFPGRLGGSSSSEDQDFLVAASPRQVALLHQHCHSAGARQRLLQTLWQTGRRGTYLLFVLPGDFLLGALPASCWAAVGAQPILLNYTPSSLVFRVDLEDVCGCFSWRNPGPFGSLEIR
jgi:hypothetical protein